MSFTAEVKDELSRVPATCSHCDKAVLAALVRIEGTLFVSGKNRYRVEIATDAPSVARLVIKLLHELYQLKTNLTVRRSVLHKTRTTSSRFPPSLSLLRLWWIWACCLLKVGWCSAYPSSWSPRLLCCRISAWRLPWQRVRVRPRGDFHFEVIVETEELADGLVDLLARKNIKARIMQRRNSYMVYLKSGSAILEFLALAGAHQSALAMENARVIKSVRNDVNRQTNAEIANQAKTSRAAIDQIRAIRQVVEAHGMENLPPALQDFIKLRVRHPEATLKELGEIRQPSVVEVGGVSSRAPYRAIGR